MEFALIGNPNCGKTTLFNLLTGANQRVGNWPGVTVECKKGKLTLSATEITIVDLPGVYSLTVADSAQSMDEQVTGNYILSGNANYLINIIDANQLERSLYLTLQLREANIPMLVVVNMLDIAARNQLYVNLTQLSADLGCPVIGINGTQKQAAATLKQALQRFISQPVQSPLFYTRPLEPLILRLSNYFNHTSNPYWYALQYIEGNVLTQKLLPEPVKAECEAILQHYQINQAEAADISLAKIRFAAITTLLAQCLTKPMQSRMRLSDRLDQIVLNRFLALPLFLIAMYGMFILTINVGGLFQDCFEQLSQLILVDGVAYLLGKAHLPPWVISVIAIGVGRGIATTIAFIPVITTMFLSLAFLESCGYMVRAAFVMDRIMRLLGLPGKSFVPLVIGFGCNVPAVLATRTLESRRDRVLTIMMSPFMSCGARLAIYAIFVAAFFPTGGQNIVFLLYLIGILMAIVTGLILRKTILTGEISPLIMELPEYHWPTLRTLFYTTWVRLWAFLKRAIKVIVPLCVILGVLNGITIEGKLNIAENHQDSILAAFGRLVTPIFKPLGVQETNWPATVGLITGMVAKEAIVGTLNTLYSPPLEVSGAASVNFKEAAIAAVMTIPQNIRNLPASLTSPMVTKSTIAENNLSMYGQMFHQFGNQAAAFAYLLFLLLYFPCISTTAVMLKELNYSWAIFSVGWTTGLAYLTGVCFFQLVTIKQHPLATCLWLIAFAGFVVGVMGMLRYLGLPKATAPVAGHRCVSSTGCVKCINK